MTHTNNNKNEQSKLDEMNNHIAELHTIIEQNFEKLPYEVQRQLGGYIWSNYEEQQKQEDVFNNPNL